MAARSCTFWTNANAEKEPVFLGGQNPSLWCWYSLMNKFSENSDSDEKTLWPWPTTLRQRLRSAIGPIPDTVSSQSSHTKVLTNGGSSQDECRELIRWFGIALFRALLLSLTFCGWRYAVPQTLTFAAITPHNLLYGVCRFLFLFSEHIASWNASSDKTLNLVSAAFAFRILLCVWISMII